MIESFPSTPNLSLLMEARCKKGQQWLRTAATIFLKIVLLCFLKSRIKLLLLHTYFILLQIGMTGCLSKMKNVD